VDDWQDMVFGLLRRDLFVRLVIEYGYGFFSPFLHGSPIGRRLAR
jgi:hypothetical protein